MRDQLAALRHQRAQDLDQFVGRDMLDRNDLGDQLVGGMLAVAIERRRTVLLGHRLGHDLDHAALLDRGVAVHAQDREEHIVDFVRLHRLGRNDRDLALHVRTEDEVLAGDLGDRGDQGLDVGILEVQRMPAIGIRRHRGLRALRHGIGEEQTGGQHGDADNGDTIHRVGLLVGLLAIVRFGDGTGRVTGCSVKRTEDPAAAVPPSVAKPACWCAVSGPIPHSPFPNPQSRP